MTRAMTKAGKLKPISIQKCRRSQQIMRPLYQLRRMCRQDRRHFVQKRLRSRDQGWICGLRHIRAIIFSAMRTPVQ